MLNEACYKKTFIDKNLQSEEIILIYRIYFRLSNNEEILNIKDNNKFFEKTCEYFINGPEGKIGINLVNFRKFDYKRNKKIGFYFRKYF